MCLKILFGQQLCTMGGTPRFEGNILTPDPPCTPLFIQGAPWRDSFRGIEVAWPPTTSPLSSKVTLNLSGLLARVAAQDCHIRQLAEAPCGICELMFRARV